MSFMDEIDDLHEHQRLELKEATFEVPDDVWPSYSAFANTEGGEIVLGVTEGPNHTFIITGVVDADKIVADFWSTVRDTNKVQRDVLLQDSVHVQHVKGVDVVIVTVPRADRGDKPVSVKVKREKGFSAWIRRGTSDVRATREELRRMEYDNEPRADRLVLEDFGVDSFNRSTIARYRSVFAGHKPSSPWNRDSEEDFLYHIGALARGRNNALYPTRAGLLAFGNEYEIARLYPHFLLDYRQQSTGSVRWDDRIVSQSGDWSGNLIDFYFDVSARLVRGLRAPFTTDRTGMRHGVANPVTEAVNEAVANALIHSYYGGTSSITVVLGNENLVVKNPGDFLVDRDVAIAGGMSEQRNPTLMHIFSFIGVSDRAGSGVQTIFETWRELFDVVPTLVEEHAPAAVSLSLPIDQGLLISHRDSEEKGRRGVLNDEQLLAFIVGARDGVGTVEVCSVFNVSQRVAQKHLAALCSGGNTGISRKKVGTSYVYYYDAGETSQVKE